MFYDINRMFLTQARLLKETGIGKRMFTQNVGEIYSMFVVVSALTQIIYYYRSECFQAHKITYFKSLNLDLGRFLSLRVHFEAKNQIQYCKS